MAITTTANVLLEKPDYLEPRWDLPLNRNWDKLDTLAGMLPSAVKTLVTSANVVDVFRYDTSNDSDGGTWRLRCQNKAWFNETLNTAARGATREFPAVALIIAETNKVTIFDATVAGCPMWMVFNTTTTGAAILGDVGYPITSISMLNGLLCATASGSLGALSVVDFLKDTTGIRINNTSRYYSRDIARRNELVTTSDNGYWVDIVSRNCNDVAMTIIPTAPIDPLTGLPTPTIVVATASGVSVIDGYAGVGTVVDDVFFAASNFGLSIRETRLTFLNVDASFSADLSNFTTDQNYTSIAAWESGRAGKVYFNYTGSSTIPAPVFSGTSGMKSTISDKAISSINGLTLLKEDAVTPLNGMVAHITKDYNTGWMKGDIRRDLICEAGGTTDSLGNLISGWTPYAVAGFDFETFTSSGANITSAINSAASGYALTNKLNLVLGKKYRVDLNTTLNSGVLPYITTGTQGSADGTDLPAVQTIAGVNAYEFTHNVETEDYVWIGVPSGASSFSMVISIHEIILDRSVKASSFIVNGTLLRAPVATGAEIQRMYSFSSANYLSQAYSADLDFGTGDFCFYGWLDALASGTNQAIFDRSYYNGSAYVGGSIIAYLGGGGNVLMYISDDGFTTSDVVASTGFTCSLGTPFFYCFCRRGNYLECWVNGVKRAETLIVQAAGSLSNSSAVLKYGADNVLVTPYVNGYMWMQRIISGSLSQDQIEKMYQEELPLFQPNAKCTLQGSSNQVNCLDYDEKTGLLEAGTQTGVTTFKGLFASENDIVLSTAVVKSLSTSHLGSVIATSTGAYVDIPLISILEELIKLRGEVNNLVSTWEDANFDPTMLTGSGTLPAAITFASTGIQVAGFSHLANDAVQAVIEYPHKARLNQVGQTNVKLSFHAHVYATTTAGGNIYLELEYFFTKEGVATTTSTTISVTGAVLTTAWAKKTFTFPDIIAPTELGSQLHFRFRRVSNAAADTYGAALAVSTIGFHYVTDSTGSEGVTTK